MNIYKNATFYHNKKLSSVDVVLPLIELNSDFKTLLLLGAYYDSTHDCKNVILIFYNPLQPSYHVRITAIDSYYDERIDVAKTSLVYLGAMAYIEDFCLHNDNTTTFDLSWLKLMQRKTIEISDWIGATL